MKPFVIIICIKYSVSGGHRTYGAVESYGYSPILVGVTIVNKKLVQFVNKGGACCAGAYSKAFQG